MTYSKTPQILCPVKKGTLGVYNINVQLRELLNPWLASKNEVKIKDITFRQGDKVMQIKNNYTMEWYYSDGREYGGSGIGVFQRRPRAHRQHKQRKQGDSDTL